MAVETWARLPAAQWLGRAQSDSSRGLIGLPGQTRRAGRVPSQEGAMDIKGMKVAELKEELKRRGLATHGLKAELAERLAAAVEAEESTEAGRGDDGDGARAGGDDSPPGDAPTDPTDRPPASEEDVDFLDDAPAAPDATPRDPKAEPVAEPVAGDGDADPATTRGVPDEEPEEEEPDYEPDDEPTEPPKRPREEEEDADAPETDADAKRPRTTNDDDRDRDGDDDAANGANGANGAKSPRAPATRALRIDNFVRPFTFNQVREMLRQFGAFAEGDEFEFGGDEPTGLWMNQPVKTHAVVVYAAVESAQLCAEALDGARWPEESGRHLAVSSVSVDEARAIVEGGERAKREHAERVVAAKNRDRVRRSSRDGDDDFFAGGGRDGIRFTRAWPRIAWRERRA